MNRWVVYEYMKNRYIRTGEIPNAKEIHAEFAGADVEEIGEGMAEFHSVVQRIAPAITTGGFNHERTAKG
jgi:hypothetical protein